MKFRLEFVLFWLAGLICYPLLVGFNILWNIWTKVEYSDVCVVCEKKLTRWQKLLRFFWAGWATKFDTPRLTCSFKCCEFMEKKMGEVLGHDKGHY